jgi:hypothetical protein
MSQGRLPNTTRSGARYDAATIESVWRKGTPVPGYPTVRRDTCGARMDRSRYGDRSSSFGWEIDHVIPVALGGSNDFNNLQPLRWENNAHESDDWPYWTCKIRS